MTTPFFHRSAVVAALRVAAGVVVALLAGCDGGMAIPGFEDGSTARHTGALRQPAGTGGSTGGSAGPSEIESAVIPGIAGEPDMRVRLRDAATTVKLGVSMGEVVWVMPVDGTRPPAALRSPVTVSLDGSTWTLSDAAGVMARYPRAAEIEVAPEREMLSVGASGGGGGVSVVGGAGPLARAATSSNLAPRVTVDGGKFGGKLRLQGRSDASARSFDVIEQVGVEDYLKGVVAAEMFPNWPLQSYCGQAVCARSYALHQRANARSLGQRFDVESTVKDQAYKGAVETGPAVEAVKATEGVVLTWNGQVLRAYYSSTSGGRPGSAKDIWPTGRGYEYNLAGPLQAVGPTSSGVRDGTLGSSSPYFRWQTARSRGEAVSRLREWGRVNGHPIKALGGLTGITLTESNAAGRPSKFTVTGAGESFQLTAEQLRFALNQEVKGLPAVTRETRVNSGDLEASIVGDVVNIKGRGFGHGVGMCQYSAKELAERGKTWREIVPMFYPGAKMEKAY
ncbi:MAG: SpoIID/LytB domain-containing protein [Phycisphaerales bacterium]|nr:SpoIID/LytB domain-containing protein [Phycisphaerales bacterium]